jgi:polysaccharide export outer membrane protein
VQSNILLWCSAGRSRLAARHALSQILSFVVASGIGGCATHKYVPPKSVPDGIANNHEFNRQLAVMAAETQVSPDTEYRIGPEDLLEVTLFDIEDEHGEPRAVQSRVSNTGFATFPYVGLVQASGLTPTEFEARLREAYTRFIHDPQLTVLVQEYRSYRVSVIGYVKTPGVLELKGRKTLLEGIAMAGGLSDEAGKEIRLTRIGYEGPQTLLIDLDRIAKEGDVKLNVDILPGDVIAVPKAGTFYVEGTVKNPGAYPLLQETTVSQAVATAGGADTTLAKTSGTVLYRKSPDGVREAIPVDLAALENGEIEDLKIQQDDVIVVPMSSSAFWIDMITKGVFRVGLSAPLY